MLKTLVISIFCSAAVVLIALQMLTLGWSLLALGAAALIMTERGFARDMVLIVLGLGILGVTPISTDISVFHMAYMGTALTLAIVLPYLVSRFIFGDYAIRYQWMFDRRWSFGDVLYVVIAGGIAYVLLPFYLISTGTYLHWPAANDAGEVIKLFIGTNALGIWDELFFINTVFALLRRHFSFWTANIFQAVMFTSFLYELGFTSWIAPLIFAFALLQGYIYSKTHSLFYIVIIHLTIDFFLFLAILHAHHPEMIRFFIF